MTVSLSLLELAERVKSDCVPKLLELAERVMMAVSLC